MLRGERPNVKEIEREHSLALPRSQGGKACTNCARIKCKCIPLANSKSCERCYRLKKECIPSATSKKRRPKHHAASRSARLEEKLDDLVTLLQGQHVHTKAALGQSGSEGSNNVNLASKRATPAVTTTSASGDIYHDEPPPAEAEESLGTFREDMIKFSPYVYISPEMTSPQLRDLYPFLWLNIMSVASKSAERRGSLRAQARGIIVHKVVDGGERSLDLLFGILTFVNWVQLFPIERYFTAMASRLAVSLIWDLGLQEPPPESTPKCFLTISREVAPQWVKKERTIEERRAVLGAFVITSMISHAFKSADGLRWSPQLDEYLSHLVASSTVLQDRILVAQVKIQLVISQIHHSPWRARNADIPLPFIAALQARLDASAGVDGNTLEFSNNTMVLGLYHTGTLIIHESMMVAAPTSRHEPDWRRFEVYQRCLNSITTWLDHFFSMKIEMYARVPLGIYSQLFYVMVCLHRITTTKDPVWDPAATRKVVDLMTTADRVIQLFEQLKSVIPTHSSDNGEEEGGVSYGVTKLHHLKRAWQSEMVSMSREESVVHGSGMSDGVHELFPMLSMDYFSGDMLPDLLNFSW